MNHHLGVAPVSALTTLVSGVLMCTTDVIAHHSTAEYDSSSIVQARGEIVTVLWRNPHVRFTISTESIDGSDELWELEGSEVTRLDRGGVPRDLIQVGDMVTFAGNPSSRSDRRMYVNNMLLADGREIILRGTEPRFARDRLVNTDLIPSPRAAETIAAADDTFFDKVLTPSRERNGPAWLGNPPLTDEAREARALYDAVLHDPVLGCVTPGMPRVMTRSGPYAVRFIRQGDDIILQNEWFEIDRLIHMDGREPQADQPYTPLGYSAGRWDGGTLVVTTTHIDWPYFQLYGLEGVPQTRQMRFVERFTPSDDGSRVQYDISATDPGAFTETVTYENYATFRWDPTIEFLPYNCVEDERRATRPGTP